MKKIWIFVVCFLFTQMGIAQDNDAKLKTLAHNPKIDSLLKEYKNIIHNLKPCYAIFYEDSTMVYGVETSLRHLDTSYIEALRIMPKNEVQIFFGKDFIDTILIEVKYVATRKNCPITTSNITNNENINSTETTKKKRKKLRKREPIQSHIKVNFIGYEDDQNGKTADEPFFYTYLRNRIKKRIPYPESAREEQISGKVVLSFVLERDGSINSIVVDPSSPVKDKRLTDEVIRCIKSVSGWWQPYQPEGKRVRSYHSTTVDFILLQ